MLNRRSDDVLGTGKAVRVSKRCHEWLCHTKDSVVVRFRAATGKNDLLRTCADQRGDLLARCFDRSACLLPKSVNRGGVAILPRQIRKHRVKHFRLDSGSGVVIQIDAIHGRAIRIDSTPPDSKPAILPSGMKALRSSYIDRIFM